MWQEVCLYVTDANIGLRFSPNKILYSPLFRDFRTWKRYEAWLQDLYIFDLENHEATIDNSNARAHPMWIAEHLYFASDRGGRLNLYRYNTSKTET